MTLIDPNSLRDTICPNHRVASCLGPTCAAWRWQPLSARILEPFVQAKMAGEGGVKVPHKEAVAWVMDNREALGIPTKPTHGFCGLGGPL